MGILHKTGKFEVSSAVDAAAQVKTWLMENIPNLVYYKTTNPVANCQYEWFYYGQITLYFGYYNSNQFGIFSAYVTEDNEIRPSQYGQTMSGASSVSVDIIDADGKLLFFSFTINGYTLNKSMCLVTDVQTGEPGFFTTNAGENLSNTQSVHMAAPTHLYSTSKTSYVLKRYPDALDNLTGALGFNKVAVSPAYLCGDGKLYTHELLYILHPNEATMYVKTQQVPIHVGDHTYWYLDGDLYLRLPE